MCLCYDYTNLKCFTQRSNFWGMLRIPSVKYLNRTNKYIIENPSTEDIQLYHFDKKINERRFPYKLWWSNSRVRSINWLMRQISPFGAKRAVRKRVFTIPGAERKHFECSLLVCYNTETAPILVPKWQWKFVAHVFMSAICVFHSSITVDKPL